MHLHSIRATNFRIFGDGTTGPKLDWTLHPTLNILVGENDAGKSAIVDAIRHVLWTTSFESTRLQEQDFHVSGDRRATELTIEVTLKGLDEDQEAALLEWLTYEIDGRSTLSLTLHAKWISGMPKRRARVETEIRSGTDGAGPELGAAAREMIRTTYLRPLRDAEGELRPGRASRLSQILAAHPDIQRQSDNDFDKDKIGEPPTTLVGLMAQAQHHMGSHPVIKAVEDGINDNYLTKFALAGDNLAARIRQARELAINPILEPFELSLQPAGGIHPEARCPRGLGYNNVLFMATELVLLKGGDELALSEKLIARLQLFAAGMAVQIAKLLRCQRAAKTAVTRLAGAANNRLFRIVDGLLQRVHKPFPMLALRDDCDPGYQIRSL